MKQVYCISGFAADRRVFSGIDFRGHSVHFVDWIVPVPDESIEAYAARLRAAILHDAPVLLGLSFGGMMCIEIAKLIPTEKVIIVSSVKTRHELPRWMPVTGRLQLDRLLPLKSFELIKPIEDYNLGLEGPEERTLVEEYRDRLDPVYANWAIPQILNWENEWVPGNIVHIHGKKDHIFPIRRIHADHVVEDGGHFMIMNRAASINPTLRRILDNGRAA